jgi:glutamyl-tRNA synthetase
MSHVVTRFAPSPTGYLHIGGARTALFSWLLARNAGGKFILRVEDTDLERSTQEATQAILDAMHWLGLDADEGPFFQSQRFELYNGYIDRMLETGHAYWCECTPEEVEAMREAARARGAKPKYAGRCRERGLGPGPGRVVRLKAPLDGSTVFDDLVKGPIAFENAELDDMVLRRADGSPTYNLAVVVDDATMGVTHVLRGDDHVNNTPRQILLYNALGFALPRFGHVPMILGPDKKKLSKRHGAVSVMVYKDLGFLPEALVNYLARLGWSHGDQEIFSRDELVRLFSADHLGASASVFDQEKLLWVNSHYIKEAPVDRLAGLLAEAFAAKGRTGLDPAYLAGIVPLYQPRARTLAEMAEMAEFFVVADGELAYDEAAVQKFLTDETKGHLRAVLERVAALPGFGQAALEASIQAYLEETGIKFKLLAQPLRVALTGKTASPGLYETMEVLGRDRVAARIERALAL